MRRSGACSASSSASGQAAAVARQAAPFHTQPGPSPIRLLALLLASLIGPPIRGVQCATTAVSAPTAAAAAVAAAATTNNNLYLDAFNATTRTMSTTAVDMAAASSSPNVSPAPADTMPPMPINSSTWPLVYTPSSSSAMFAHQSKTSSNSSTSIKSPNALAAGHGSDGVDVASTGAVQLSPAGHAAAAATTTTAAAAAAATGAMATTTALKTARSTSKEPMDATRSRNHWVLGVLDSERPRSFRSKHHHEHHWGPFFEEPLNSPASGDNLVSTAHLFTEAVLNCRVGMLKDKTVMWVRRTTEKVSLLTVGNVTYSGDPRIRVKFQYPNNWRLLINPTKRDDAGIYMCQVSTHPPRVFTTNLTILEPPLRIIDEHERDVGDRYYKSGSTVDLQCQVSRSFFLKERYSIFKSVESPSSAKYGTSLNALNDTASELSLLANLNQTQAKLSSQALDKYFTNFITWAKDEEPLQALASKRSSLSDKWLNSRISIPDATLSDSGNYSCSLGRLFTVIVQVQVLTGELPAAVQHNLATSWLPLSWLIMCLFGIVWKFSICNRLA